MLGATWCLWNRFHSVDKGISLTRFAVFDILSVHLRAEPMLYQQVWLCPGLGAAKSTILEVAIEKITRPRLPFVRHLRRGINNGQYPRRGCAFAGAGPRIGRGKRIHIGVRSGGRAARPKVSGLSVHRDRK